MINHEEIRENVKILLNIQDAIQDSVLDILIRHVESHLVFLLNHVNPMLTEVPNELSYIVEEVTMRRFNRLGSEGYESESVEGHSVTFQDLGNEFLPYLAIIESYRLDDDEKGEGKVIFI